MTAATGGARVAGGPPDAVGPGAGDLPDAVVDAPRRTALHAVHERLGAHLTDFAGWMMPLRYGSEVVEHTAVRTAAGLFDLSHMGEVEVRGPGAAAALDHALVGRMSGVALGRAKYTMICTEDGGVLDDLVVYRLAEDRFLVVANAGNAPAVVEALRHRCVPGAPAGRGGVGGAAGGGEEAGAGDGGAPGPGVEVLDLADTWSMVAVQGPRALEVLTAVAGDVTPVHPDAVDGRTDDGGAPAGAARDAAALAAQRYYSVTAARLAGHEVLLARTGYTGEDGFEVLVAPDGAVDVWEALTAAGAGLGLVPAGLAARDSLRLEAGMPLHGHELDLTRTPFEAGLGRVVALDRPGGFVGEAALRARRDLPPGAPARTLVGLVSAGRRSPRAGHPVLDPTTGEVVGEVTSGAPSPTLGHPIAMALVDVALTAPGTPLVVDVRGRREPVTTTALPFYRRPR